MRYEVVRLEPKAFWQVRVDADGRRVTGPGCMRGVELIPYRLDEIREAIAAGKTITIVEGEADADALWEAGEAATTNPGGAGKWKDAFSAHVADAAEIRLWPDWDDAGRSHMAAVYASIRRANPDAEVRIVRSAGDLKDARDHLEAGHTLKDVVDVDPSELPLHRHFVEELNAEYAVAAVGPATVILHEYRDPELERPMVEFMTKESFRLRYANRRAGKSSIADLWLRDPDRRTYERVVFNPGPVDERYYNLWRGFAVEAWEGDCSRFLAHVEENICAGDKERCRWLMAWIADAVQNPADRPGTAVVLRGAQGVGKGVFCRGFGSLFGSHFLQVTHARHLVGHFNAHLKD